MEVAIEIPSQDKHLFVFLVEEASHHRHYQHDAEPGAAVTEDAAYWKALGQKLIVDQLSTVRQPINKKAKNIIFFLGDGMSNPTVVASRIYKGQKYLNKPGEETFLEFEKFPYIALSKTYCVDAQVADSACSATAYLTGVKGNIDTIGVDANVAYKNCTAQNMKEFQVDSIMKWAQDAGKATGIVTTTKITHATPAGTYAHVADRDWESDKNILDDKEDSNKCDDIAEQLIKNAPGKNFKVILGGGRVKFQPNEPNVDGERVDKVNLVDLWKKNREAEGVTSMYAATKNELSALDASKTDYLLGLFASGHLDYRIDVDETTTDQPSLKEMTEAALKMLTKESNVNGFVLLVEGGRIDQAHHDGRAKAAFEETVEFEKAISYAVQTVDQEDTLIIVTADHSHTMTINGYPKRGNNIFGVAEFSNKDGLPWPTISYATGPGYRSPGVDGSRFNVTSEDMEADDYKPVAMAPDSSESHGGDDVTIYARGPQAHLFQGVYEQHYIAHVMGYASCIGPGLKFCDNGVASVSCSLSVVVLAFLMKYLMQM